MADNRQWLEFNANWIFANDEMAKNGKTHVAFVLRNLINCYEIEKNYQFRSRTIAPSAIGERAQRFRPCALQNASPELITGHIERRCWCEMVAPDEFPQTYIHSIVIGVDGIFCCRCTNDSLRGNRTIERWIEKRCASQCWNRER